MPDPARVLIVAGFIAAGLQLGAFFMSEQKRLRRLAIMANVAYVCYGLGTHAWLTFALHATLLPLNMLRLRQLLREQQLIDQAVNARDVTAAWLSHFMTPRTLAPGSTLFARGDAADAMYLLATGSLHIDELAIDLAPGVVIGEIGLFSPDGTRTQTITAPDGATVLVLRRDEALALYRRDPAFGIYLTRLITRRLVEDVAFERAPVRSLPAERA